MLSTQGKLQMEREMDLESWSMAMEDSTKANGRMTCDRAKALNIMPTETSTMVPTSTVKLMVKESTLGQMAKFTMVNGTKASSMVTVSGKVYKETPI